MEKQLCYQALRVQRADSVPEKQGQGDSWRTRVTRLPFPRLGPRRPVGVAGTKARAGQALARPNSEHRFQR